MSFIPVSASPYISTSGLNLNETSGVKIIPPTTTGVPPAMKRVFSVEYFKVPVATRLRSNSFEKLKLEIILNGGNETSPEIEPSNLNWPVSFNWSSLVAEFPSTS